MWPARRITQAMRLQRGSCGSSEVKDAMPRSRPHAVRIWPDSSGGLRQCQQPHGPVHAHKGLSVYDAWGFGTEEERDEVEAQEDELCCLRTAPCSTRRASSSCRVGGRPTRMAVSPGIERAVLGWLGCALPRAERHACVHAWWRRKTRGQM